MNKFLDAGSIPAASTKQVKGEPISLGRWIRLYHLFLIFGIPSFLSLYAIYHT
ncbi:MAG: hypothetical protein IJW78_06065 [Clostridia bacterium]|nr:hypothetical protein [Clostridia bacterium]